ncbi:hypothetical protein ABFS82_09G055200 [Erythranthe guttata]|uniref:Uncharacterized protein n=1 Tax=Erythranthe guttata TaxID=4155 RepID=A0A022PRP9_ERYGU|nr:hypothetical protein MIMGU_mgv1a016542mg [Erythranthe guttata]
MKGERKRKRVGKVEQKIKSKGIDAAAVAAAAETDVPSPMDEEVDEFFAILRRMRVAAKYFQNRDDFNSNAGGGGGDGPQDLTTAVEAAAVDGSYCKEAGGGIKRVVEDCGLDLNRVP